MSRTKRVCSLAGLGVAGLAVALLALRLFRTPHPMALITVIDPAGKPIAGALITPDGLRPKRDGGHYLWLDRRDPKPSPVLTDATGTAVIPYPFYTQERLETAEISFRVDHPAYCSDRPFRTVNQAPPGNAPLPEKAFYWIKLLTHNIKVRPSPVVLKPGAIVELTAYLGDTNAPVTNLYPQIGGVWLLATNLWRQNAAGVLTSHQIPEGERVLRVVHVAANGALHFSDPVSFSAAARATNRFRLPVRPGVSLVGQLDAAVPRPVTGGRVVLEVFPGGLASDSQNPGWHAWAPLDSQGTFRVDGLPSGTVEVVGICDGYISRSGRSTRRQEVCVPQRFTLDEPVVKVELVTEPAATFRLTATDERGRRVQGAKVSFSPNVLWRDTSTTIFCADLYRTEESLTNVTPSGASLWGVDKQFYAAATDADGVAVVTNLPASAERYWITHPEFEVSVVKDSSGRLTRHRRVQLRSGEVVEHTIVLQKRGKDQVQHPQ